jgi:tetratricopeptide (TPR) repeat protein
MKNLFSIPLLAGAVLFCDVAVSALQKAEDRYADCMDLAERAPDKAINMALIWQNEHGGVPARHCEAYGLYVAGEYEEAAVRMEQIAEDMRTGKDMPVRMGRRMVADAAMLADMYGQAAKSWLYASEIIKAEGAIDIALSLTVNGSTQEADLIVTRARIAAADQDYGMALKDLERVYKADPQRKSLLVLIAAAARGLDQLVRADQALNDYLQIFPNSPDGHLERGNLYDRLGQTAKARASWLRVIELSPAGPDADAARANLERLDLGGSVAPENQR